MAGFDVHPAFDADLKGDEGRLIVHAQIVSQWPSPDIAVDFFKARAAMNREDSAVAV
jgi:hypothetical protein